MDETTPNRSGRWSGITASLTFILVEILVVRFGPYGTPLAYSIVVITAGVLVFLVPYLLILRRGPAGRSKEFVRGSLVGCGTIIGICALVLLLLWGTCALMK